MYSAYFPIIVPFLSLSLCCRLGLGLLKGGPQLVSDSGYVFIHMLGRGASPGDLCAPQDGEVKVNWEPWPTPKH